MEEKKKDKIIIYILIGVIVILLLIIGYFFLIKKTPTKDSNIPSSTTTTTIKEEESSTTTTTKKVNDPKTIELKLDGKRCISALGEYYLTHDTYVIDGFKFSGEDYTFKYIDKDTREYYLNDKLLFKAESNEAVLSKVCNYEDYLLITMGWEGYPTTSVYDINGKSLLTFTGDFNYKNGLLFINEYDYNEGDDFYTMTNYSVNLAKDDFNKHQTSIDKINCDEAGYVC